jgi:hypothetical protein
MQTSLSKISFYAIVYLLMMNILSFGSVFPLNLADFTLPGSGFAFRMEIRNQEANLMQIQCGSGSETLVYPLGNFQLDHYRYPVYTNISMINY